MRQPLAGHLRAIAEGVERGVVDGRLGREVEHDHRLHGIELELARLRRARQRLTEVIPLQQAAAADLPLRAAAFEAVRAAAAATMVAQA